MRVPCTTLLPPAKEYGFDVWTTAEGLPQNTVNGVVQTPDGHLWLATFDGLARFDGVRFTIFDRGNSNGIVTNRLVTVFANREEKPDPLGKMHFENDRRR